MTYTMPAAEITYTPENFIMITTAGDYEINYSVDLSIDKDTQFLVFVRQGNQFVESTLKVYDLKAGARTVISGNTIAQLTAGEPLALYLQSMIATTVSLSNGVHAMLTIKKLN